MTTNGFALSYSMDNQLIDSISKMKNLEKDSVGFSNYLRSGSNNDIGINKEVDLSLNEIRNIFFDFIGKTSEFKEIILNGTRENIQGFIDNNEKEIQDFSMVNKIDLNDFYEILMLCIGYIKSDRLMSEDIDDKNFPASEFLSYFNTKILGIIKKG